METAQTNKLWPWIVGGCGLLLILSCISVLVFGGSLLFANRLFTNNQAASKSLPAGMSARTAALQNLQGWVEFESDKGDWSPALENQLITAGQHVRTGELSSVNLVFKDGSQAMLKADSEIAIDELDAQKGGNARTIIMTQVVGESSHQVVPNKRSDSRYEVRTPSGAGVAKGTEFQVVVTPEQTAYYYVTQGVVAVSAVEITVLVNPGFMTILYLDLPPLEPVQTITVEGLVSQVGDSLIAAGTTFITNDKTITIGTPQVGDWVMVKGHLDENNKNIADWVIVLHSALTNQFSLTGTVEAIGAEQWKVNGQTIEITETTEWDETIKVGDKVYVKGTIQEGGALQAYRIERVDEEAGMPFSFTGIVQKIDGSLWTISGVSITTDKATTLSEGLKPGDRVEVKGRIQDNGVWLAEKITLVTEDENEFEFTGKLQSKDPWKVAGIAFETRDYTAIPADLKVGELVRVEGVIDADGVWIATKIERIDAEAVVRMVIIGTVITRDPWVVSGIPLKLAPDAKIGDGITVGMLVRVELVLQSDGTWLVVEIEPISTFIWFPGCIDVIAKVISVDGDQLHLENWPVVTVEKGTPIEGTLVPNSIIRMRICFDGTMIIKITYIIIIDPGIDEPPEGEESGKVAVCHKPGGKKGGKTLTISRSALPAHLGHGDYQGACR